MGAGRNIFKKKLAPGIWEDMEGHPHIDVPEIMALFKIENTPQNVAAVTETLSDVLRERCPDAKIVERTSPED